MPGEQCLSVKGLRWIVTRHSSARQSIQPRDVDVSGMATRRDGRGRALFEIIGSTGG
ncbi:hypothetical protein [Paracidovorax cattleyae]|uniref:hypothetical protein n=1 Tax=Paracidovorax cattleyae TaxID=80868 RepID=UPI001428A3DD|nr:hypothetical protein [Paracidovorax cattleyae]MBF9263365.1 hypothetical protein [Paracidovorax cattleyae]